MQFFLCLTVTLFIWLPAHRYTMDYVKEAAGKWDEVVESFGVKVFIDPRALLHIVGSTMDFVDDHVRAFHSFSPSINRRVCFRPL